MLDNMVLFDDTISLAYTVGMWAYSFGNVLSGILIKKFNYKLSYWLGGLSMIVGYLLSGSIRQPFAFYLTYGVLRGGGCGILFNTSLSALLFFKEGKTDGLSGVLLMVLGLGSVIFSPLITHWNETLGWRGSFTGLGLLGLLLIVCAWINPRSDDAGKDAAPTESIVNASIPDMDTKEMLGTASFWKYIVWSIISYIIGQSFAGYAAAFGTDIGVSSATCMLFVSIFSLCNSFGRLILGKLFELFPMRRMLAACNALFIVGSLVTATGLWILSALLLAIGAALVGLGFGSLMVCNVSVTRTYFGTQNYAMNFSIVTLESMPASALSMIIMNAFHDGIGSYLSAFACFLALSFAALLGTRWLRPPRARHS